MSKRPVLIGLFSGAGGSAKGPPRRREGYYRLAVGQEAMGISWMTMKELSQAIPPAYTKWVGKQLIPLCQEKKVKCGL